MKLSISIVSLKKTALLFLFFCSLTSVWAWDDVIQVKNISAGSSYGGTVIPERLVDFDGFIPNPPSDLVTAIYHPPFPNIWHTKKEDKSKAWILIELADVLPVSKVYFWNLNQNTFPTRDIKDITITYSVNSTDGTNGDWTTLGDFVIAQSLGDGLGTTVQTVIDFNVEVRFVRIAAKTSYGDPDYWGLGKIMMVQDHSQSDNPELLLLKEQIVLASARKFYDYTDGTWADVSRILKSARALLDSQSTDISAIIDATDALKNAISNLIPKINMAQECAVTTGAIFGKGYEAEKAVDKNFNTRWATPSGVRFWYQIDLGVAKDFNQVAVFETPYYSGRINKIDLYYSNDNENWTLIKTKRAGDYYISIVGETVNARYVKLSFTECTHPEGINVDEIMVFNDASAIETPEPTPARPVDPSWIKQESSTTPHIYHIRKANLKYGMFIHYGINTFVGQDWTDGSIHASSYNPNLSTLDPESWVKTAYEGGMNFIILVAKHHEGFALWNTAVGSYNINNTGREGDKRDIVKEVSDACKKYGIKLGLYYSVWDRNWDRYNTQSITGFDRVKLSQVYNDFALDQITELLDGRYGEISELWIDGAWAKQNGDWEFLRLYHTVKMLQPTCQFGINNTINTDPENLKGGETMQFFPSDFRLKDPYFTKKGADADPKVYRYNDESYYLPFEATICINNSWFWKSDQSASSAITPEEIKDAYNHMVEQENTFVLNLAPNTDGLLNSFDVDVLYAGARELGIEREAARSNIPADECAVEVRFVTDKGYIASSTEYIYGKEGEDYTAIAKKLGSDGYELITTPANASGKFTESKITLEFIYEDTGVSVNIDPVKIENQNIAYASQGKITLIAKNAANVVVYNIIGEKIKEISLSQGAVESFYVNGMSGVYIVRFIENNGRSYSIKLRI